MPDGRAYVRGPLERFEKEAAVLEEGEGGRKRFVLEGGGLT